MDRIASTNSSTDIRYDAISGLLNSEFNLPDLFCDDNIDNLNYESAQQLSTNFLDPISEYLGRPRKNFRSSLVESGCQLIHGGKGASELNLSLIKDAVECLHAGSLIVDDIQDGSTVRRGLPSFHVQHGIPAAICAGNWMYFWPLRLLEKVEWSQTQKIQAYEFFNRALELGHYGQYLDITTKANGIPESRLADLSIKTAELKTGTITALAFVLGAIAAGASRDQLSHICTFGSKFGLALQRLDDWSNLCSLKAGSKRFEDLIQNKPTTVWYDLVRFCNKAEISTFKATLECLPDTELISSWLANSSLQQNAFDDIKNNLRLSITELKDALKEDTESTGIKSIKIITENLLLAYN
jgi:geranylgeranyl pyrophosphate synthase